MNIKKKYALKSTKENKVAKKLKSILRQQVENDNIFGKHILEKLKMQYKWMSEFSHLKEAFLKEWLDTCTLQQVN